MQVWSSHGLTGALLRSLTAITTVTLAGCTTSEPASTPMMNEAVLEGASVPSYAPVRTTYLRIGRPNAEPRKLQYSEVDGMAIFEGDIVLGRAEQLPQQPDGVSAQGVAISGAGFRWPNALVPFTIDANLANQARVTNAIRHWQERTNVRFILRDASNAQSFPNFVTFRTGTGCSSSAGMIGGEQFVNLATGCSTGNTIHEIGHALGLWHEQSREDRNTFVQINWENIEADREHNFTQHISDGDDLGAYDYNSIMHYGALAFSSNGLPTIEVLTPGATIGQRTALSSGDIEAIFALYPEPAFPTGNCFFTLDYDGDGDDDLVIRGPGGEFFAYRSIGGAYQEAAGDLIRTELTDRWNWASGHRFFVMDYDGDGDDDLLARDAGGHFFALRSERTHFTDTGVLYFDPGMADTAGWNEGNRYYVMDYDGDGDDDLIGRYAGGEFVALRSERTHLVYAGVLAFTSLTDAWGWNDGLRFFAADYDGDGDDDLFARNAAGDINGLRSDRTQFTWVGVLYSDPGMADTAGWNEGNRYYVMDYDGDGDDDLIGRYAGGDFVALRSERTHLVYAGVLAFTSLTDAWGWNDANRFFVADTDGDGDDDLLARNAWGIFNTLLSNRTSFTWVDAVASTTFRDP